MTFEVTVESTFDLFLRTCPWEQTNLRSEDIVALSDDIWFVEKWNWDYEQALLFQQYCVEFLRKFKSLKIFIFCSHPHCFTLGRGLQKSKNDKDHLLLDFDPMIKASLPFPLHQITRGGGLTFHYPGQWVCYPITNLNGKKLTVYGLMDLLLTCAREAILHINPALPLSHENELLGLWSGQQKLASIGLAVTRFITFHGMALNIFRDSSIDKALEMVNPCGLPGATFVNLEQLCGHHAELFRLFHELFKMKLKTRFF